MRSTGCKSSKCCWWWIVCATAEISLANAKFTGFDRHPRSVVNLQVLVLFAQLHQADVSFNVMNFTGCLRTYKLCVLKRSFLLLRLSSDDLDFTINSSSSCTCSRAAFIVHTKFCFRPSVISAFLMNFSFLSRVKYFTSTASESQSPESRKQAEGQSHPAFRYR